MGLGRTRDAEKDIQACRTCKPNKIYRGNGTMLEFRLSIHEYIFMNIYKVFNQSQYIYNILYCT
jgi:hypothetical protein